VRGDAAVYNCVQHNLVNMQLYFASTTRFPMPKDALLYDRLVASGLAGNTFTPSHPDRDTLCLVHDPQYVDQLLDGSISAQQMRRIGLPWSQVG
jgi:acetoin utilization deacetylase AcuC-like enzyme